ncbi:hypothetical protein BT69DRAFT_1306563, partial [Atractiella rhizophila]
MHRYDIDAIEKEIIKGLPSDITKVIAVFHDESTFTANNVKASEGRSRKWNSWPICSTYGWLEDAGGYLEYGRPHEGYWDAEKLIEQVEKSLYQFSRDCIWGRRLLLSLIIPQGMEQCDREDPSQASQPEVPDEAKHRAAEEMAGRFVYIDAEKFLNMLPNPSISSMPTPELPPTLSDHKNFDHYAPFIEYMAPFLRDWKLANTSQSNEGWSFAP